MYDYTEYKKIALHVLNGILCNRKVSMSWSAREEIAHDAAVKVFERIAKTGQEPGSQWAYTRSVVINMLRDRKTVKREKTECVLSSCIQYNDVEKEDTRGWYNDLLNESPGAILDIHKSRSRKAMFLKLKDRHGPRWVRERAEKISHVYEVLRWTNGKR